MKSLSQILPVFPRTRHLPHKAHPKRDDLVCTLDECRSIWTQPTAVQEKIDGSSCRMTIWDGQPVVGNREHILKKGYNPDKIRTPAKEQFRSVWGWWYQHRHLFVKLRQQGPYSVYGDWMYMQHGMHYDLLPSLFMTYDVYDFEGQYFLDVQLAESVLHACGFAVVPLLHYGPIDSFAQLEAMANGPTASATARSREGVYLKVCDGQRVVRRFKMVREGFNPGEYLSPTELLRNRLAVSR